MQDSSIDDEASSSEVTHLASISNAPIQKHRQSQGLQICPFLQSRHTFHTESCIHAASRLQDSSIDDEASRSKTTHLPSISSASIPEVEEVQGLAHFFTTDTHFSDNPVYMLQAGCKTARLMTRHPAVR